MLVHEWEIYIKFGEYYYKISLEMEVKFFCYVIINFAYDTPVLKIVR